MVLSKIEEYISLMLVRKNFEIMFLKSHTLYWFFFISDMTDDGLLIDELTLTILIDNDHTAFSIYVVSLIAEKKNKFMTKLA